MMRLFTRFASAAVLLAATAAMAQSSSSLTLGTVSASARIYKPITFKLLNTGLSFGDIFSDSAAAVVVTLDPATDLRTSLATLPSTGTVSSAHFQVGGKRNATYSITMPTSNVLLKGPGTDMVVNSFKASVNNGTATAVATGLIPDVAAGTQNFNVGAVLNVNAGQGDGDYTGTFSVTVAYN